MLTNVITILLIAIGLAMDAFAVSLCVGASLKNHKSKTAFKVSSYFGAFQAFMPLIGWFVGGFFREKIEAYDHWIALILLAFVGGKMLYEAFKKDSCERTFKIENFTVLLTLAFATSIDALVVGLSISMLEMPIIISVSIIGIITFIISFIGVYLGKHYCCVLGNKAEILGGIVLIAIGVKIVLEHLQIFNF